MLETWQLQKRVADMLKFFTAIQSRYYVLKDIYECRDGPGYINAC